MTNKFLKACKKGYLSSVKFLVKKGVDVNVQEGEGLLLACKRGNFYVAKFLYEKGVNAFGAFSSACASGNLNLVEFIVEEGYLEKEIKPDWWEYNNDPFSLLELFRQGKKEHFEILKFLTERKKAIVKPKNFGTFLKLVCKKGSFPFIEWLFENYEISEKVIQESLNYAVRHGHVNIVKFLISKVGDASRIFCFMTIDSVCGHGHFEMVKWLIENKDEFGVKKLDRPLEYFVGSSISSSNKNLIRWFLRKYPNINRNEIVCWISEKSIVPFLLNRGFKIFLPVTITKEELGKYRVINRIRKIMSGIQMKNLMEKFYDPECVGGKIAKSDIFNFLNEF